MNSVSYPAPEHWTRWRDRVYYIDFGQQVVASGKLQLLRPVTWQKPVTQMGRRKFLQKGDAKSNAKSDAKMKCDNTAVKKLLLRWFGSVEYLYRSCIKPLFRSFGLDKFQHSFLCDDCNFSHCAKGVLAFRLYRTLLPRDYVSCVLCESSNQVVRN